MTIVVGFVPTPEGEAALDAGIREARLRDEPLHVVNTSRGDSYVDPRYASADALDAVRARLAESGLVFEIEQQVGPHDASEELVAIAARVHASLLVIGLRRRSATGKLITGSQAQRILLDASCPVLAVKAAH